ncbi:MULTISPECIES: Mu transposase C-terminal domain-containing protein [Paenibacillus]|uniref:Mu transposase-like protein n=1 Tax=Paenibacillus pabuli TaxID=1472 RepID=A0A855XMH5_9BACL|nr:MULTISPECIES: Mu transposase C-terminal domain-containing protein [Paenibacillus]PWW32922.1 Mu transposase-like protein [Paenibacillus pabuli]PXV98805.1 Mu transposase-like protein [Paenibacillus taichungensis]
MKITLCVDEEISFMGKKHKLVAIQGSNVVLKRSEGDHETFKYSLERLISDKTFRGGKMLVCAEHKKYESILEKLPEEKREEVTWKYEVVRPLLLLSRIKQNDIKALFEFSSKFSKVYLKKDEDIKRLTQEELITRILKNSQQQGKKLARSTLMRYLKAYREGLKQGIPMALDCFVKSTDIDYIQRKDTTAVEICSPKHPEVVVDVIYTKYGVEHQAIIKETVEKDYLNTRRLRPSAIYRIMEARCTQQGLKVIPEISVRSLLKQLSQKTKAIFRDGKKGIESYTTTQRGYSETAALYPLHMVQIDHTKLDIVVVDEKTGLAIGRPIITFGIDVYTRMIWCMHLSFDEPSANKVRKAIEHGIFPKSSKERYGTTNDWSIFGIPTVIFLDNGSDFTSVNVKRLINETLESEVRYRPRKTPHYGGVIERLMGSINTKLIHNLPGSTGSNISDRGDRNPVKEARLTLHELEQILAKYIVDVYQYDRHRGLPDDCDVPFLRYQEGVEQYGNPPFIAPHLQEYYHIEMLPSEMKSYTRKDGITMSHIHYRADHLAHLVNKREVKYKVKYDDDDVSYIFIQLPDSKEYVQVSASSPSPEVLEGMNRYTWNKIKDILREKGSLKRKNRLDQDMIRKSKEELQELIAVSYKPKLSARKMNERMGGQIQIALASKTKYNGANNLDELLLGAKAILSEREAIE